LAALAVVGGIGGVEFVRHRSRREVVSIVSQLTPGTPFSAAVQRLGQPTQTITSGEEIDFLVESMGARAGQGVATNSLLHTFVHDGPPFRYILVFTDQESLSIVYADWCAL